MPTDPTVPIGTDDGLCDCDAATPCPLGRLGSQPRCTRSERDAAIRKTTDAYTWHEARLWMNAAHERSHPVEPRVFEPEERATMFIEWCALHGFGVDGWPPGAHEQLVAHFKEVADGR